MSEPVVVEVQVETPEAEAPPEPVVAPEPVVVVTGDSGGDEAADAATIAHEGRLTRLETLFESIPGVIEEALTRASQAQATAEDAVLYAGEAAAAAEAAAEPEQASPDEDAAPDNEHPFFKRLR